MELEHSADGGRTWKTFYANNHSAIWNTMRRHDTDQVYDDGTGNLYRWPR